MADWESGAVKRPGIEKRRAKAAGISTREELERDARSSNPTRQKEGRLGLRFEAQARARKGKHTLAGRGTK